METVEKQTSLRMVLPGELFEHFEALALVAGMEVEQYIAQHLATTRDRGEADSLFIPARDAKELRRLLGSQVGAKKSLAEAVRQLVTWEVGGWKIALPVAVQEQIYWYCKSAGSTVEHLAPQLVLDAIREKFRA